MELMLCYVDDKKHDFVCRFSLTVAASISFPEAVCPPLPHLPALGDECLTQVRKSVKSSCHVFQRLNIGYKYLGSAVKPVCKKTILNL
jgi:hypothetical protein